MATFLHVQVAYNQGLIRNFVVPGNILACDFVAAVRGPGRFRAVRFQPDIDEVEARALVNSGNATMVEASNG